MSDQIDNSPKTLSESAELEDNAQRVEPVDLPADDPLADLIKLIQQEDPFKDVENKPDQVEPEAGHGLNLRPVEEKQPLTLEEIEAAIAAATEPADNVQEIVAGAETDLGSVAPTQASVPASDVAYVPPVLEVPPSRSGANENLAPAVELEERHPYPVPEEPTIKGVDPFDLDSALQEFRDSNENLEDEFHNESVIADMGSFAPEPSEFDTLASAIDSEFQAVSRSIEQSAAPEQSTFEEPDQGEDIPELAEGVDFGSPYDDPAFEEYDQPELQENNEFAAEPMAAVVAEPEPKKRGGIFAIGLLIGLVLIGGVMYFTFQSPSDTSSGGEVPFLQANNTPIKETPENPGGQEIANQDRLVFNGEENSNSGSQERLVSREEPVEQIPKTEPKDDSRPTDVTSVLPPATTVPNTESRSTVPPPSATAAPAPRRVRTVVVRPDGTVVSNPTPAPVATQTPAPTAISPAVPAATSPATPAPTVTADNNGVPLPSSRPVQVASANPASAQTPAPVLPVAQTVPTTPASQANAPVRITPPASPAVSSAPVQQSQQVQQTAAVGPTPAPTHAPVAATVPTSTGVSPSGEYVVQVAARRSEEQALGAFEQIKSQYGSAIGRYGPLIQRADLGDRGVYYRLRLGPMSSQSEANQVCANLKAAGLGDCLVRPR